MNHDALFKMLLKAPAILRGFFELFLPEVAKFIDFGVLEFVDKERHAIDGRKRTGDLLVKTRFKGEAAAFLIHLEHQAQPRSQSRTPHAGILHARLARLWPSCLSGCGPES